MDLLNKIKCQGTIAGERRARQKWFNSTNSKGTEPDFQVQYKTPKLIYHDHAVDELYQQILSQRINDEKTNNS